MCRQPEDNNLWDDHLEVPDAALPVDPDPEPQLWIEDEGNLNLFTMTVAYPVLSEDGNEEVEFREIVVELEYDEEQVDIEALVLECNEEGEIVGMDLVRRQEVDVIVEEEDEEELDTYDDNFRAVFGESPDTTTSEEEDHDEDDGHLPQHLQFTQRIPSDFSLPWNHEEAEESLECPEDRVSRRRRREEDHEEELPAKRPCRDRDV
ncbi:uncharacterized protein LOC119775553 [Cyprinodon tularosa]|uniref:uncharacterized protein LOC119775553 n=1 Tax=Cyprinodon tularosa TaxID=77115 RepID=UPI0018E24290|nr:uncharacterized protein LOC119775553 [Cyprinodon tularosa]